MFIHSRGDVNCGWHSRKLALPSVSWFKGSKGFKSSRVPRFLRFTVRHAACSSVVAMTAKDFTELIAWQRADDLERFVQEMIKRPTLAETQTFCEQASDAAASAPRNIAEGHGRFAPAQFANFLRIAIGSEQETSNQIIKAWQRGCDHRCREIRRALAKQTRVDGSGPVAGVSAIARRQRLMRKRSNERVNRTEPSEP